MTWMGLLSTRLQVVEVEIGKPGVFMVAPAMCSQTRSVHL